MLDTFKARLKAKAKALGVNLSQKRIDAFADRLHKKNPDLTEEADHDAKIEELHDLTPLDEIARQDDKLRTFEKKDKETKKSDSDEDTDGNEGDKGKGKANDDTPAWAKALMQEVQTLKAEKVQQTIQQKVSSHEKIKGIPAQFLKGKALPQKEEDIDAFAEEVANDYTAFKQELTNQGFAQTSKPVGSAGPGKEPVDPKQIDAILDSI